MRKIAATGAKRRSATIDSGTKRLISAHNELEEQWYVVWFQEQKAISDSLSLGQSAKRVKVAKRTHK